MKKTLTEKERQALIEELKKDKKFIKLIKDMQAEELCSVQKDGVDLFDGVKYYGSIWKTVFLDN